MKIVIDLIIFYQVCTGVLSVTILFLGGAMVDSGKEERNFPMFILGAILMIVGIFMFVSILV